MGEQEGAARRLRTPSWLDLRLVLGLVLVLVAVVVGARVVAGADKSTTVWGMAHDVAAGTKLTGGDLRQVRVRLYDDAEWAAATRARLRTATVHPVRYGTRQSAWRALLRQSAALSMTLPDEIRSRRWDVILVDGPAGYNDDMPGRMKSIYEASRLIAPGGTVFVHDCERPVEAAYCARYLRKGRLRVEVKGRALLRGYGF